MQMNKQLEKIYLLTALIEAPATPNKVLLFAFGRNEYTTISGGRDAYEFTRKDGERIIAEFTRRQNRIASDYEHQMLLCKTNGKPAPASGWITAMQLTDKGLEATVEWTETALSMIKNKEYRYTSPAFLKDPETGRVNKFINFALTNIPATDGCQELVAASLLTAEPGKSGEKHAKEANMDKKVLTLLGLAADAPEQDAEARIRDMLAANTTAEALKSKVITALGLTAEATPETIEGALLGLKSSADKVTALSAQVAQMQTNQETARRETLISEGLADGRLSNAQKDWAKTVALDVLSGYLKATPKGSAAPVTPPVPQNREDAPEALTAVDLEILANLDAMPEAKAE
jgi:phage I-like protein